MKKLFLSLMLFLSIQFSQVTHAGIGWITGAAISAGLGNTDGVGVHLVAGGVLTYAGIYSLIKVPGAYSYVLLILDEQSKASEVQKLFPFVESDESIICLAQKLENNADLEKNYTYLNPSEVDECTQNLDLTHEEMNTLNSVLN